MRPCSTSFADLERRLQAAPAGVALFTDGELLRLSRYPPFSPSAARDALLGELLVRHWLYGERCPPELARTIGALLSPAILRAASAPVLSLLRHGNPCTDDAAPKPVDWQASAAGLSTEDPAQWDHFRVRLQSLAACDGLFPLVQVHTGEAVAVPFRLSRRQTDDARCRDLHHRPVPEWSRMVADLARQNGAYADVGMVLDVVVSEDVLPCLRGDSFGLALLLAAARGDRLPEFRPLDVLATGAFQGGFLQPVDGLAAKQTLAGQLGARVFFSPAAHTVVDATSFGVPVGSGIEDCLQAADCELERLGLGRLTVRQACRRIGELAHELRLGQVTLPAAAARLQRYEAVLDAWQPSERSDDPTFLVHQQRQQARGLWIAIANHRGQPERARVVHDQLIDTLRQRGVTFAGVDLLAHCVVCQTDLGQLDQAEALGRELLGLVDRFDGEADERVRCEMVARGVLGGQPLLQKALCDSDTDPAESLVHLRAALARAEQMSGDQPDERSREICRDATQIALWHALHRPPDSEDAFHKAEAILRRYSEENRRVSLQYLRRVRFLGAYRDILLTRRVAGGFAGFAQWDLPEMETGHNRWLLASGLKYRGALYAASGDTASAVPDFLRACDLLDVEDAPLLRFIGLTAALQAGESLRASGADADAGRFLIRAREGFDQFVDFLSAAPFAGARWLERCRGLIAGRDPATLPDPQRAYIY